MQGGTKKKTGVGKSRKQNFLPSDLIAILLNLGQSDLSETFGNEWKYLGITHDEVEVGCATSIWWIEAKDDAPHPYNVQYTPP